MPETTAAVDVFLNRTSIAIAKRRSIVKSWLPPSAENIDKDTKANTDGDEPEESDTLNILPDHVGVGAASTRAIADDAEKRNQSLAKDKLRKQILGNKGRREMPMDASRYNKGSRGYLKPTRKPIESERGFLTDDEDSGKASMFASKKKNVQSEHVKESFRNLEISSKSQANEEAKQSGPLHSKDADASSSLCRHGPPKRGQSFLNDILAERQLKQKKRRKG